MDFEFSFSEMSDMLLTLGECRGNCAAAARLYEGKYPDRRIPNRKTFASIERRLRENGSFRVQRNDCGGPRTARTVQFDEEVLNLIGDDNSISTRSISRNLHVSKSSVHLTLPEQLLCPFHIRRCQDLLPQDTVARLHFCRWISNHILDDPIFLNNLMMTDECYFTRNGITNLHNMHQWADENPFAIETRHFQNKFSINVWAGIVGDYLIGPVMLPARLNGNNYLQFLQETLPDLLDYARWRSPTLFSRCKAIFGTTLSKKMYRTRT